MAKRKIEEEIQNPEEEQLENVGQEVEETQDSGTRCLVYQVKDGETKVAETLDDGWDAEGIALVDSNDETLFVVALTELQLTFGGENSEDLEEDVASPSMTSMDGEQRSAFLLAFYQIAEMNVPALEESSVFGWLPSGGEMALIYANKNAINEKIEAIGGDTIGDGKYWTSQRFSNDRMWSCNMADGTFGIALGTASVAGVRPVKK